MTATALNLVNAVKMAGGRISVEGARLRIEAAAPLPEDLVDQVRQQKAEVLEFLGSGTAPLINTWTKGLDRLQRMAAPSAFPDRVWNMLIADAATVTSAWASMAAALGWTTLDLFGVGQDAPYRRIDLMGVVPILGGKAVVAMTEATARIRCSDGTTQTFCRKPPQPGRVALWELP